jgi:glycosyltransferase involved in cell wall biosynthesis
MTGAAPVDIAIFIRNLAGGGIERVMLDLAEAFTARGLRVEFVVCRNTGARTSEVPAGVPLVELDRSSLLRTRLLASLVDPAGLVATARLVLLAAKPAPTLASLPALARYLRDRGPRALLAATPFENLEAIRTRRLARVKLRLVLSEHNNLARNLLDSKEWARRHLVALMRRGYPHADAIVAVSDGVAEQIAAATGLPRARITTIHNPVVDRRLVEQLRQTPDDP